MDSSTFYKIYLPALKQALEEDHINYGFMVRSPAYFIGQTFGNEIMMLLEQEYANDPFIILVEEYFDAKTHYAPDFKGIPIGEVKAGILEQLRAMEEQLNANEMK